MAEDRSARSKSEPVRQERNASLTVHVPVKTLEAFQRTASALRRSESDLAREALDAIARRT